MRTLLVLLTLLALTGSAFATPQMADIIIYGKRKYVLYEVPMLGLWDFEETRGYPLGDGRKKPPQFDLRSTANWDGYEAEFEIRDSRLYLNKLKGYINGKKQLNEQILPEYKFPTVATWYTGRIHLAVGDADEQTGELTSVLVFEIEQGLVKSLSFQEKMQPDWTWNGFPDIEEDNVEKE